MIWHCWHDRLRTKRATFKSWLQRETEGTVSAEKMVLPIGGNSVRDKRPAVIAALVAAELLETYARRATVRGLYKSGSLRSTSRFQNSSRGRSDEDLLH